MADDGAEADGGTATVGDTGQPVDYLDEEINIFKPATPFMRDNLKMMFGLFAIWLVVVFGPVVASIIDPVFMTETRVLGGYPLNFFLTAFVGPAGALVLAAVYAWYRDRLDAKYNIAHDAEEGASGATATDGGER